MDTEPAPVSGVSAIASPYLSPSGKIMLLVMGIVGFIHSPLGKHSQRMSTLKLSLPHPFICFNLDLNLCGCNTWAFSLLEMQ